MSLDRFINKEELLARTTTSAIKWTEELSAGGLLADAAADIGQSVINNISLIENAYAEICLYDNEGVYVQSTIVDYYKEETGEAIIINGPTIANAFNVKSGEYLVVVNLLLDRLGSDAQPALKIEEISPDRTEVYLRGRTDHPLYAGVLSDMEDNYIEHEISPGFQEELRSGNLLLNFGKNRVSTILAQDSWTDKDGIIVKVLKPISDEVNEGDSARICFELSDPIILFATFNYSETDTTVYLRSPNFDAESEFNIITETEFLNFTNLLGKSTATSEQVIQNMISGSIDDSPIGIDYSAFENFVFYSSAAERLANFKYKKEQIEHYETQIAHLSATNIPAVNTDRQLAENRKSAIIGSFDGFEKWLYNEPTTSLFTHQTLYDDAHRSGNPTRLEGGTLASDTYQIQPFPKFLSSSHGTGELRVHNMNSTIATEWYEGTLASASLYDSFNDNALVTTIPEHIRLDPNNDQYELFVNMIGQHYDILYSYADALAKIYHPIEHPKLGHTKDTLYNVAKSMGWKLFNGKQASALWQYKLGKSETGSLASTGSIFTKTDEEITTEVWRRIVNNLPYLLKTKGTARGIKALMNTYGIPQTLLSIREYGGPKVAEDVPLITEDRFSYALHFNSGSSLIVNNSAISSSFFKQQYSNNPDGAHANFKGFAWSGITNDQLDAVNYSIPPITREFRFRPASQSNFLLYSTRDTNGSFKRDRMHIAIEHTGSYSGSDKYGRVHFAIGTDFTNNSGSFCATDYIPIYDGDFWNLRFFFTTTETDPTNAAFWNAVDEDLTFSNAGSTNITYHVQCQKASDYISDKIVHRVSASMTPDHKGHVHAWANGPQAMSTISYDTGNQSNFGHAYLGGRHTENSAADTGGAAAALTSSFNTNPNVNITNITQISTFSGSMQEFREWTEPLDQKTFDLHTTNPTSYVSAQSPSGSFDTLITHFPLGTDLNATNLFTSNALGVTVISGSHPNNKIKSFGIFGNNTTRRSTQALAQGFTTTDSERGSFLPVEETYYIQGVSLGASLPKSQKIRFDDNELISTLSPNSTAESSKFDLASLDSNRLGLFYSMADQINKDIFNNIGDVALDDFVGDPDDQYEHEYPDLTGFSKEY